MQTIRAFLERNLISRHLIRNYGYRTILFTFFSLWLNAGLGVVRLVGAWVLQSVWYAAIGGYYIVLCGARYLLLRHVAQAAGTGYDRQRQRTELQICRKSGISQMLLSLAFLCAVFQMVFAGRGYRYPGHLIVLAACAALYKIVFAAINLVRTKRGQDMILLCIRQLNIADALVSLVSLQTAVLATIGTRDTVLQQVLNAASGTVVCLAMLCMGLLTARRAARALRK